ncbi:RNA polymerase sigma-70 factor [Pedobacter gandavensis]|uniref:RNA polymerase sigma factor n=1 Tax=Pedobacter gandavensis TaxID=2679963 RepID=UPI0024794E83|nr:RNA polymerase sigma-70 factor [Pedobacter gandavensis]WGQ08804.1 RNA polymerase sigma-70 factor [Pedobacter gandavensis]
MLNYETISDNELAELLRSGDRAAFTEIYNRYKWLLHTHAYKWMQDREEAKDIIHELFAALWTKRESLSFPDNLSAYLYTAVRNRIFNVISHQKVASQYLNSLQAFIDEEQAAADHLVREKQMTLLIEKEIAALPAKMRAVFELSRKEQLSHKEIAEQLTISEHTVRKHVQHALKILRVKLGLLVFLFLISP